MGIIQKEFHCFLIIAIIIITSIYSSLRLVPSLPPQWRYLMSAQRMCPFFRCFCIHQPSLPSLPRPSPSFFGLTTSSGLLNPPRLLPVHHLIALRRLRLPTPPLTTFFHHFERPRTRNRILHTMAVLWGASACLLDRTDSHQGMSQRRDT